MGLIALSYPSDQGVWLECSWDGTGIDDELEGFCRVAMVEFEKMGQGLAGLEGNDGKEGVAGQCKIEGGPGPSMAVPVFLPGGSIAFMVIAVFDAPVPTGGVAGSGFLFGPQTGKEDTGVVLGECRLLFFGPVV
jgi:hypothetical protein